MAESGNPIIVLWRMALKLQALIERYQASSDFMDLAPNSQVLYQQMIDSLTTDKVSNINSYAVETISPHSADQWYQVWSRVYGVSKAQMMCKVMRKIWNWGYRAELIARNPWSQMQLKGLPARQVLWTGEDYVRALTRANGNIPMQALLRALWETGQRPVDVLYYIAATDIKVLDDKAVWLVTQQKTGKILAIELSSTLELVLKHLRAFPADFIRNYHNHFAKLGMGNLQLRDIRRTVATEMAEGGATDEQIRALLGHSGHSKMPETVYVVRNAKMAGDGLKLRANALLHEGMVSPMFKQRCDDKCGGVPCEKWESEHCSCLRWAVERAEIPRAPETHKCSECGCWGHYENKCHAHI